MSTISEELIKVRQENENNHYNLLAERKKNAELIVALTYLVNTFKPYRHKMNIRKHFSELNALASAEKIIHKAEGLKMVAQIDQALTTSE